ncbi:hypothetical protein NicSoilB4_32370 [Arthrobacter sp. NicSoilB4]|uniref:hypothetical protein n=1 Tax=Arthrobacter sp. NicSoilB4 TaxID=2830997 RepID=UPI001CC77B9F|nr:hypothetical protein [Arthrobacter sp. NicSoilB4]BCW68474.1 hypothetical protein NicSoilB4_32370 [Arthrobacter sp. NicSoilB4]
MNDLVGHLAWFTRMLVNLKPSDWIQLWSGTVGAFVAAVIGGVVSLMVVFLANRRQSQIAAQQLQQQSYFAHEQLRQQWEVTETQHQAASRARENEIIANLVVAAQDMMDAVLEDVEAMETVRRRMSAAIVAWKFESKYAELFRTLTPWPYWIANAGKLARHTGTTTEQRQKAHAELRERVKKLISACEAWPRTTASSERVEIINDLKLSGGGLIPIPADPIPWHERLGDERGH